VKAAALVEAATGRDFPQLETQLADKAGGWLSAPPPVAGQGLFLNGANYSTLLKWNLGVPLLQADCAGRPCPLSRGPVDVFGGHAVPYKKSGFGTFAHKAFSAKSLPGPEFRTTARGTSPETDVARRTSC